MKNWYAFLIFLVFIIVGQISTWFQLNAQFIDNKWKNNYWILFSCIPVTWIYLQSTKYGTESFGGQLWPQRLIAFAIGISIYTLMTNIIFGENLNIKNGLCIILSLCIVAIQILWKN